VQQLWQVAFLLRVDFKSVSFDVCCKTMSVFQTYLSLLLYKNDRNYMTNTSNSMVTAARVLYQMRLHVMSCIYQSVNRNTIVHKIIHIYSYWWSSTESVSCCQTGCCRVGGFVSHYAATMFSTLRWAFWWQNAVCMIISLLLVLVADIPDSCSTVVTVFK
jgi:hypothetical protein